MNLNWKEFEEGFKSLDKQGNILQSLGETFLPGVAGRGGLVNSILGGIGKGNAPGIPRPMMPQMQMPQPKININLGEPKNILTTAPGDVRSMSHPTIGSQKLAGFIDANVLRSVLTAKAVHGISNTVIGEPGLHENTEVPDQKKVLLESKYPDVKKLLADPQTKAYLESLITPDPAYDTPETDIHPSA